MNPLFEASLDKFKDSQVHAEKLSVLAHKGVGFPGGSAWLLCRAVSVRLLIFAELLTRRPLSLEFLETVIILMTACQAFSLTIQEFSV